MRFYSRFSAVGSGCAFNALVLNYSWLFGHHVTLSTKLCAAFITAVAILYALETLFVYWEFDNEILHVRRFWTRKTIRRSEIRYVSGNGYWRMRPGSIKIDYLSAEMPLKAGRIYADPKKLSQFIATLHQFAPEAAFDI